MKKQIVIKIIGSVIIFSFAMFFLQAILSPQEVNAANELNWENPNKNGNNPYKFKPQDILNSQMITQVVGCTGVVNRVSAALTGLFQKKLKAVIAEAKRAAVVKACQAAKKGTLLGTALTDKAGTQFTTALGNIIDCGPKLDVNDRTAVAAIVDNAEKQDTATRTTQCFNGIAKTLVMNQLTAMTRYTVNWINTGFNGNPLYVQNITSLTNGIEKGVLETGQAILTAPDKAYPYGADFSRSMFNNYNSGGSLRSGATNFLDSMTSDLSNFVTDPNSYLSKNALERAKRANDTFAGDFSSGGWNAWLALTQRDQNNPLGFAMQVSQYEADQQAAQLLGTKEELLQNNGFLSQKRCAKYSNSDGSDPDAVKINTMNMIGSPSPTSTASLGLAGLDRVTPNTSANPISQMNSIDYKVSTPASSGAGLKGPAATAGTKNARYCLKWEVVTPGSIIKDQLSNFVNSPVRQLELANTINDSLNSVFASLISKLQEGGLARLAASKNTYVRDNIGVGAGSISTDSDGISTNLSSGYSNGSFDLTRDLGNKYIYNYPKNPQSDWNAQTNKTKDKNNPELNIGVSPITIDAQGNIIPLFNVYYYVKVSGNTKLITNGYNGWAEGDKAFWNGSEWQNWKKGTANPVDKRGVIQDQKDYIVAAKELLSNLPGVMPALGELDYCIPGPNPNWEVNSSDAYSTFSDYSYSLNTNYIPGTTTTRDSTTSMIAKPGQPEYDNYKNIFDGTNIFSGAYQQYWNGTSKTTKAGGMTGIITGLFLGGPVGGFIGGLTGLGMGHDTISTGKDSSSNIVTQTQPWIALDNLGTIGKYKNGMSEDKITNDVNELLTRIGNDLQDFFKKYAIAIEATYGASSLMQKQFLEQENVPVLIPNTAWLPMASDGLNITKDITNYAHDINQTIEDTKDNIITANSNITKMDAIKKQVSLIIKDAQTRRNANLIRILNEEATRNKTPVLTEAAYNKKYDACLSEEDISYYDSTDLVPNANGTEAGRCHDGIDNDLNGLIDSKDPACSSTTTSVATGYCSNGAREEKSTSTVQEEQTSPCASRQTENECTAFPYYHLLRGYVCKWNN